MLIGYKYLVQFIMKNVVNLPFKVGEEAEARSFENGFRGAWFRCKIEDITEKDGELGHVLNFFDFTDDIPEWTQLYQVRPLAKERRRELMLRPCYPPIYKANQMPHASAISQVSVIVDDSWKVGDPVDWRAEDCFWCGRITQLLADGKAQIKLKKPPYGEGSVYEVELKDVRPSLDWSPKYGWTVPTQTGVYHPNAWLLKPINQDAGKVQNTDIHDSGQETETSLRLSSSQAPSNSAASDEVKSTGSMDINKQSLRSTVPRKLKYIQKRITSQRCRDSKTDSGQAPPGPKADAASGDHLNSTCSAKKYIASGGLTLNSTKHDTLEAAVMDLEEYVNKVKWLKAILGCGIPLSDGNRNGWEFVEPLAAAAAAAASADNTPK